MCGNIYLPISLVLWILIAHVVRHWAIHPQRGSRQIGRVFIGRKGYLVQVKKKTNTHKMAFCNCINSVPIIYIYTPIQDAAARLSDDPLSSPSQPFFV
jgi:hypothetical protein